MLRLARTAFLLLVFSMPFMKPHQPVGGLSIIAADLMFLVAAVALAGALVRGVARPRWDPLYAVLLIYFAAMLLSAFAADDPHRAWLKLATQVYLLALPLAATCLIASRDQLQTVFHVWLAATAVTVAIGLASVGLFFLGPEQPLFGFALHEFGSLPPGNYPRLESTFRFPAMICNYLTVSLMMLLVARHAGWIGQAAFWLLFVGILLTALFTLTPGLGGIFLVLGLWGFVLLREKSRARAALCLAAGTAAASAFLAAAALTPIDHPTAPFVFHLPGGENLYPSVRMMTWIDAAQRFVQEPLLGIGIGADAADVRYVGPSGSRHHLTDAHNAFLNIAAQCGALGLAAMVLLVHHVGRRTGSLRLEGDRVLTLALGLGWLSAFAYQGLSGSFEDARHLWLLLGLFIAASRLEHVKAPLPVRG